MFGGYDGGTRRALPKKAKELGPLEVKRLGRPGKHAVGGVAGLCLQITEASARSWIIRTMVHGARREIGLGGYPDVTLARACEKAREIRDMVEAGLDPLAERRRAKQEIIDASSLAVTFEQAAERWHRAKRHEYRNAKHAAQVLSTLKTYASPVLGKRPVGEIRLNHIVEVLEPLWTIKTETASRLRGRVESVLSWATVSGFRSGETPRDGRVTLTRCWPGRPRSPAYDTTRHLRSITYPPL